MRGIINNYNFEEMEPMKYYSPPSSWTTEKRKTKVQERIFSGEWFGSEKKDGYFSQFIKDEDGNMFLLSRSRNVNGVYPNKIEWVPQLNSFFEALPNGTCLLGELYLPFKPGSRNITSILGCLKEKAIKRQEKEKLHFYIFDILAKDGESWINKNAIDRFNSIELFKEYKNDYTEFANYCNGNDLWLLLQTTLLEGGEGIVITHQEAKYEPGKRPSKTTMKVKKELKDTVDCFFTGKIMQPTREYTGKSIETWKYWIDAITEERLPIGEHHNEVALFHKNYIPCTKPYYYKWAGSMEIGIMKEGKVYPIGYLSGLTDEIKSHYQEYTGTCIEVIAMEKFQDTGALRHGKMIGFRDDLTINDCTYEKYMGIE